MAHAQKPDFVFRRSGRVHLNRRWRQFSRLLAAEVCASAVVMLDTPCSEVVWRLLATHSIRQFLFHFPSRTSPCAITFQLDSTSLHGVTYRRLVSSLRRLRKTQTSQEKWLLYWWNRSVPCIYSHCYKRKKQPQPISKQVISLLQEVRKWKP